MKTAVCVGNGTWLPQVTFGRNECTIGIYFGGTDSGGTGTYAANYYLLRLARVSLLSQSFSTQNLKRQYSPTYS